MLHITGKLCLLVLLAVVVSGCDATPGPPQYARNHAFSHSFGNTRDAAIKALQSSNFVIEEEVIEYEYRDKRMVYLRGSRSNENDMLASEGGEVAEIWIYERFSNLAMVNMNTRYIFLLNQRDWDSDIVQAMREEVGPPQPVIRSD